MAQHLNDKPRELAIRLSMDTTIAAGIRNDYSNTSVQRMYVMEHWRQQLCRDTQQHGTLGHLVEILSRQDYVASELLAKASAEYKLLESRKFTYAALYLSQLYNI